MNIAFEVVPRTPEARDTQIDFIEKNLDFVDTVNVPDILRFPIRSWEVGDSLNRDKYRFIPHFRAIDFDLNDEYIYLIIEKYNLTEVLLVSGDPPPNFSYKVYDNTTLEFIRSIRSRFPKITIFAGFDPYRYSIKDELKTMKKKLEYGADYLMSQPFFDMKLLEIYGDLIPSEKLFLGVSPVVSEKSQSYWEKVNHVVFPKDFQPTYQWNIDFSKKVLDYSKKHNSNVYFMPINVNLEEYFLPIKKYLKES
ncbi:MAG: methylenetetrahydrofolate reductase [Campylobacterales bacterium]|nr:methylenetetrahydrofolate reductase [Campylobacterales bacterium]